MAAKFAKRITIGDDQRLQCTFRQHKAESHCRFLHTYGFTVDVWYDGDWTYKAGVAIRRLLHYSLVVAKDDPLKSEIQKLMQGKNPPYKRYVEVDTTGCESFSRQVFNILAELGVDPIIVTIREHDGNSASYSDVSWHSLGYGYFVTSKGHFQTPKGVFSADMSRRLCYPIGDGETKWDSMEAILRRLGVISQMEVVMPPSLEGEEWRKSHIAENHLVSNRGRVLLLSSRYSTGCKLLSPYLDEDGYVVYAVGKAHRLVYDSFISPLESSEDYVLHKNGVTVDNIPDNLKLGSARDNHKDRRKHGTQFCGGYTPSAYLSWEEVKQIRAHPLYKKNSRRNTEKLGRLYDVSPCVIDGLRDGRYSSDEMLRMAKSLNKVINAELKRGKLVKEILEIMVLRLECLIRDSGVVSGKAIEKVILSISDRVEAYVPIWKDLHAQFGIDSYLDRKR